MSGNLTTAKRVAVLGGGMTGLTAAFYLAKQAEEGGVPVQVTVYEAADRWGGRVNTLRRDGCFIERGPDSFLARKQQMVRLAEELGLADQLTGTNPEAKHTYIARDGVLHPMPAGLNFGVPTDPEAFLQTGLLTEEGKRRALAEADVPPAPADAPDETVGAFLSRRFGEEMVRRVFEPLLAGIYAGDLYRLGLNATFPQFREMERRYGSLIRGMTAAKQAVAPAAGDPGAAGRAVGSAFLTFRTGLSTIMEALEARLRAMGCELRLQARVTALTRTEGDGAAYRLRMADGGEAEADAVVLALPAAASAGLLDGAVDVSAMRGIRYVSVANVVLGYDAEGFGHALDGSGFLVPKGEGSLITASTWTSAKWLHTAPPGKRLIRCYVGRSGEEANAELPDDEITAGVKRDLRRLMGLAAEPAFVEITRLPHSMPQYPVGHREAIASFEAELAAKLPGVRAAGQPFGGVGLPDCVAEGKKAAESLVQSWSQG